MEDFEMDEGGGEDEGQIAIEALKEMRDVFRAAMARMPNKGESVPEAIEDPIMEAVDEASMEPEMEEEVEAAPIVEKKTVLQAITPKYSGSSDADPEMAALGKLKAKKKGF